MKNMAIKIAHAVILLTIFGSPSAWGADDSEKEHMRKVILSRLGSSLNKQTFPDIHFYEDTVQTKSQKPIAPKPQKYRTVSVEGKPIRQEHSVNQEKVLCKIIPGKDGRKQVLNTDDWPNSVHGLVQMVFRDNNAYVGSGTLIAPNLVLTAAHNLYEVRTHEDRKPIGRATKVRFFPAKNGQTIPFQEQSVRDFYYPEEYTKDESEDYGLLVLNDPIGEKTGYFGISVLPSDQIKKLTINVTGYPYDKVKDKGSCHEMWGMGWQPTSVKEDRIYYEIDTFAGQSGSGVWYQKGENYFVIGAHIAHDSATKCNFATPLTKARYKTIKGWAAESLKKSIGEKCISGSIFSDVKKFSFYSKHIRDFGVSIFCEEYVKHLPHLTSLCFVSNGIGDEGAKALAKALAKNTTLTVLDLSENHIGDEGAKALATIPALVSLHLMSNKIRAEGAKALVANTTIEKFDLSENPIGDEGAKALLAWVVKKNITSFQFPGNRIGDEGAEALAKNTTLTELWLGDNRIGDEGAKALAKNTTLTSLWLYGNRIGDEGAEALAKNTTLTFLNLNGNPISSEGVRVLIAHTTLRGLNLNYNKSGPDSVKLLVAWAIKKNLTSLECRGNQIGDEGTKELADTLAKNTTFTSLSLFDNQITDKGAKALAEALTKNITLTYLDLYTNQIEDEGTKVLAEALTKNITLTQLNIMSNEVGDEGARALAEALTKNTTLTSLDLSTNKIGDGGARALALTSNTTLTRLSLIGNQIGDEGAKELAKNTTLTRLQIWFNKIGDVGKIALRNSPNPNLRNLKFY